jgi:F-box protein 11
MPDEVLLTIFSYLLEQDLCRLSLVCKRFQTIANDTELWKSLYQNVYEYDIPLFNMEPCKFQFIKPEDSDYMNPWKESFRQLYRGIHVRLGYQDRFNTVQAALDCADERNSATNNNSNANSSSNNLLNNSSIVGAAAPAGLNISNNNSVGPNSPNGGGGECGAGEIMTEQYPGCLIFLHAGTYRGEFLVIDSDVALIGAAAGNVAESIVLERESESTVMFVEGAKHAYVGHMTLKFSPEVR